MRESTLRTALLLTVVGLLTIGLAFSTSAVATGNANAEPMSNNETNGDWFEMDPSTSIHTPERTITEDQVGIIEVSVSNPGLNDKTAEVSMTGSYPSGTSVTGENLASVGGGQFTGDITVQPGSERTIQVRLEPNEINDFQVTGQVFVTHENTDTISQDSLERSFTVEGIPEDIDDEIDDVEDDETDDQDNGPIAEPSAGLIGLIAVIFLGSGVLLYARNSDSEGAEVTIEE